MEKVEYILLTPEEIKKQYLRNYWVSWYHYEEMGGFEFNEDWPCWHSEQGIEWATVYFIAIRADCFNAVRNCVAQAYDKENLRFIDFRFMITKPNGWSPFCDKYPRADWMKWG